MNWKEQINKWTVTIHVPGNPPRLITSKFEPNFLPHFISTEIIEKLIADIPDDDDWSLNSEIKQQLRHKWL
jgi:hypothetical protein